MVSSVGERYSDQIQRSCIGMTMQNITLPKHVVQGVNKIKEHQITYIVTDDTCGKQQKTLTLFLRLWQVNKYSAAQVSSPNRIVVKFRMFVITFMEIFLFGLV